jgi:hypothetical protein
MRQPAFANRFGPNSSIMAYGRFNQAAQPGDGVTQLWGVIGPYDFAAIRYGYGVFGTDAASERRELAALADTFSATGACSGRSEERGELIRPLRPRPARADREHRRRACEATRLGVANLQRSLARLEVATGGDPREFAATYELLLARQIGMLRSVQKLIGGVMPALDSPPTWPAPAPGARGRTARRGALPGGRRRASLEPYAATAVAERVAVFGANTAVDRLQAGLITDLLAAAPWRCWKPSSATTRRPMRRKTSGTTSAPRCGAN